MMHLLRTIQTLLPAPVSNAIRNSFATLQKRPYYRSFLRKQLATFSVPQLSLVYHEPCVSSKFSERLLPHLACAYEVQGDWRGVRLCFGWLFLLKDPLSPRAWISDIWVHPVLRGGHVGYTLMQKMMEILKEHSIENVGLFVEAENEIAIHLYESLGFLRVPVDPNGCFPPCGKACVQMECSLANNGQGEH